MVMLLCLLPLETVLSSCTVSVSVNNVYLSWSTVGVMSVFFFHLCLAKWVGFILDLFFPYFILYSDGRDPFDEV